MRYIAFRPGKSMECSRAFFSRDKDLISPSRVLEEIGTRKNKGVLIHKIILSPGVQGADTRAYTRHVIEQLEQKNEYRLEWRAVIHDNTDHEHAHVIVFGRDRDNRPVRFSKDDYTFMREQGDKYIDKTVEPILEIPGPEPEPENPVEKFFKLLVGPFGNLGNIFKDSGDRFGTKRKDEQMQAPAIDEDKSIGRLFSEEEKLAFWAKQKRREEIAKERASRPIEIELATNVSQQYTQNTPKTDLLALKTHYEKGYYSDQLSKNDIAKIDSWVKQWEQWEQSCRQIEKRNYAKSFDVDGIELETRSGAPAWFSDRSDLTNLRALFELHEKSIICLKPDEVKALSRWIKEKELVEPIVIDLGEDVPPLVYRQRDPIESLRLLANIAKDALEPSEYKRLWRWIYIKEEEIRKEAELNKPITIETDLGRIEFTRHDSREQLLALHDACMRNDVTEASQLTKAETERLKAWIKERDEKDRRLDRERGL